MRRGALTLPGIFGFLAEVAVGVVTSLLFVFVLRLIWSPKLKLDDNFIVDVEAGELKKLRFKITNERCRQVNEVEFSAHFIEDKDSEEEPYSLSSQLKIITIQVPVMEKFDRKRKRTDYYNVIGTSGVIGYRGQRFFGENKSVRLRLRASATDPYSQIRKTFTKNYSWEDARAGTFLNPVKLD